MSAFRSFAGSGFDFATGLFGGYNNLPTGKPSLSGGMGELLGKAAKQKVELMKSGMQYKTMQQTAATKHFQQTGQKIDLFLPPKS